MRFKKINSTVVTLIWRAPLVRELGGVELTFDASNDFVERAWAPGLSEGNVYSHAWQPV